MKEQYRQHKPIAEHEIFLTQELADAMWRMKRSRRMEAEAQTSDQLLAVVRYIASIAQHPLQLSPPAGRRGLQSDRQDLSRVEIAEIRNEPEPVRSHSKMSAVPVHRSLKMDMFGASQDG